MHDSKITGLPGTYVRCLIEIYTKHTLGTTIYILFLGILIIYMRLLIVFVNKQHEGSGYI